MRDFFSPESRRNAEFFVITKENPWLSVFVCGLIFFSVININAQKIAILTPENTAQSKTFSEAFENYLAVNLNIVNSSLAENILEIKSLETPYNLTIQEAKNLGVSIGCNYFIVIKTDTFRRTDFGRDKYFEAFAAIYLVSSKTGRLVFFKLEKFEEDTPQTAKLKLFSSINNLTKEIKAEIKDSIVKELNEEKVEIAGFPEADSPAAKSLRPPLPYRRLKPKYTALASLFSLAATVDVLADIDENGKVLRTEIVRWAGFGLDESVVENIYKMNWRPASRDGKNLPMRVLLRYNFRNIETEQ